MAGLEPASRDVAAQARLAALHEGWPGQSPRRPRPVSRLVDVPHPGSNEPETIGYIVSCGCIRMTNADVTDLYNRTKVGTKIVVLR